MSMKPPPSTNTVMPWLMTTPVPTLPKTRIVTTMPPTVSTVWPFPMVAPKL
ncbi:hypothetical protein TCAL_17417 [Tigriopus californicus]|uniref:Uncharacterized protein n=1 Tax=Tigriopus californicus TaxID=6832 RepID=A0A553P2K3_TIGCA|nr:hypothetical protein TCAL_17417 [Tigriopus californicus]